MLSANPNDNGLIDSAPNNRNHHDGKRWAQDFGLEQIAGLVARIKCILAVVTLVVAAAIVLSRRNSFRPADPSSAPSSMPSSTSPPLSSPNPQPSTRRPTRPTDAPTTTQPKITPAPTAPADPALPPTDAPTTSPAPTAAAVTDRFIDGLPPYSKELASTNASSPQAKALEWLQKDPLYHQYPGVYRLNQRYALAVLYYSTKGESWLINSGWLSDGNECSWYQYDDFGPEDDNSCTEASRLAFLDLFVNGLDGTIPMELELLTDLEYMRLQDSYDRSLLGKIHSEL
jgi:hypothetical protein